ncbi:MAG: HAMP domain-containing sensor histidine kinase [Actinomycetes bacterium]
MSFEVDTRLRRRVPIRWRLAGGSALMTFLILMVFGVAIGVVLSDRLRSEFSDETADAAVILAESLSVSADPAGFTLAGVELNDYAAAQHAKIRILDLSGNVIGATIDAPDIGITIPGQATRDDFLIETRSTPVEPTGNVLVQYARPTTDLNRAIRRIWLLLAIGVAAGTLLALLAGLAIARRTLRPLADLTNAAREVSLTGRPDVVIPMPPTNDEVRDLAETLSSSYAELDAAKARTEESLQRQREFVADASHELRTPLTALIANLEMLTGDVDGAALEDAEAALRSGRRMRDLVVDLLLLARADADRLTPERVEIRPLVNAVLEEVAPLLEKREISVEGSDVAVEADRAALLRAVRNLVVNAIVHTPDRTNVVVSLSPAHSGEDAVVTVDDSGPGIPPEERERIFERFISGGGDHGPGTGLGLSIVKAVAQSHGGSVSVGDSRLGGARFALRLPAAQASTTTGTTIGRLRS